MYIDQPLREYLDDLSSSQPAPGGGSAAALSGALAAALASMVTRLTIGKTAYADVQAEIETLLQQTEDLRARFQQLMQEDIEAYERLSMCFKLPRDTSEASEARSRAIQVRLYDAALIPLEVAECAAELIGHCLRIAEIGNKNVLSDIATGATLTVSAAHGAAWMVRVNLRSMENAERVQGLSLRLNAALQRVTTESQQVITIVGGKV